MTNEKSVYFRILGPVEVSFGEEQISLRPKQTSLLATLLLQANRVVSVSKIIDTLWGGSPPSTPEAQVRILVSEIRKTLATTRSGLIRTQYPGYLLRVSAEQFDLEQFTQYVRDAQRATEAGNLEQAVIRYGEALGLWRGRPLDNVRGHFAETESAQLSELRLGIAERHIGLMLDLGRHVEVVEELNRQVHDNPFREKPHSQLMLALHRCGRVAEALDIYAQLRQRLAAELGLEPTRDLQQLHHQLLTDNPVLRAPASTVSLRGAARGLPPAISHFVGRECELAQLDALGANSNRPVLIVGAPGIGKTALAIQWANRRTRQFPDGQLFLDMRGFDPSPAVQAEQALIRVLRALGLPDEKRPTDFEAQISLLRSITGDRRFLLILDNVADPEQVRPLLSSSPGSLVLVTSRDRLSGLVAVDGAVRLTMERLREPDALEILAPTERPERLRQEPDATAELGRLCGYLPLALRIAAVHLSDKPHLSVRQYVTQLKELGPVNMLHIDGDSRASVRNALDLSYQELSPEARRMFHLLSMAPSPKPLTPTRAAALAAIPLNEAEQLLDALSQVHLLRTTGQGQFVGEELLLQYAAQLTMADMPRG
ncbi:DNA-binding SARP family transcriptional activator [Streptomyces umbrinus]|uniref:DNA-binding SARP family transcriptional activator n=1 Tax=Streptomyces umbrinus TaxID=67370 RepID=A0ABU0SMD9_9ACTN|nr:BTAD domain-containing putative transcriptional regulator [Streptomyces umbrinus]MDQ1024719.1 DNA-binding SARP family transcriptional activator [Streptomyces umbrinus]